MDYVTRSDGMFNNPHTFEVQMRDLKDYEEGGKYPGQDEKVMGGVNTPWCLAHLHNCRQCYTSMRS